MTSANSALPAARTIAHVQSIIGLVRSIIRTDGAECNCRDAVDHALAGLEQRETELAAGELLAAAVRQREKIIKLTDLLRDLDEAPAEGDGGVIEEAALLFDDLALQARVGARLMRAMADGGEDGSALS